VVSVIMGKLVQDEFVDGVKKRFRGLKPCPDVSGGRGYLPIITLLSVFIKAAEERAHFAPHSPLPDPFGGE